MTDKHVGPAPDWPRGGNLLARLAGLGFALIGFAAVVEPWWNALALWDEFGPGPAFAPSLLGVALIVLGLILASGRAPMEAEATAAGDDAPRPYSTVKFTLLLVVLIAAFPYVGGVLALSLFVAAEMLWVERAPPHSALLSGLGAFALIWFVFIQILAVPLPPGLLRLLG